MIGVIHVYTEEIKEMGELTSPNKREYCEKHGYKFIEVSQRKDLDLSVTIPDSKYMEPRMIPIGWSKIKLLKDTLENNKDIEWLFWIDADAVFMNYNKKLESFVNDKAFFIVGQDCNGINVGTFFIKNCQKSIDFLEDIWNDGPTIGSWWGETEQGQIDLHGRSEKYFDGFMVVSNKLFNSYLHNCSPGLLPCSKYEHGVDFLVHLPGQPNKIRTLTQLLKIVIK
jgi:hypothetical protein